MGKNWLLINLNKKYFLRSGNKVFECQIGAGGVKKAEKKIKYREGRENFNHFITYLAFPLELLKNSRNSLSGDNIIVVPSSPNTFP